MSTDADLIHDLLCNSSDIAKLRARVEVAEAGFAAAASKAQWQSVTNRELNNLREVKADLLEALKLAERHCPVNSEAEILARAAIAKAEGKA